MTLTSPCKCGPSVWGIAWSLCVVNILVALVCLQSGGFYSAEDADSYSTVVSKEKQEGAFCVWPAEEIRQLLPDPIEGIPEQKTTADVFMHHYGIKEDGNVNPMKVMWEGRHSLGGRLVCLVTVLAQALSNSCPGCAALLPSSPAAEEQSAVLGCWVNSCGGSSPAKAVYFRMHSPLSHDLWTLVSLLRGAFGPQPPWSKGWKEAECS